MKSNSLELENLVIMRDGAALTPAITLKLGKSEMLLVRGNNGSGKSTFLKTLAGLLPVEAGHIKVGGVWPAQRAPLYLGHKRGLITSMSVYDNVAFWAKASGFPELTAAAMHYFELSDVANSPLESLSAGWQQRVALTRLITIQSPLWLLDEPVANLDAAGTGLLQTLMQARLEQGGIIVLTSHAQMEGDMLQVLDLNQLTTDQGVSH